MIENLSISELARLANVSVRTIRFYIDEGLLPAPDNQGRSTSYDQTYLDRLELIRRLKDAFLPLKEIRRQIGGLNIEEVRRLLAQEEAGQPQPLAGRENSPMRLAEAPPAPASAQDYIHKALSVDEKKMPDPMLRQVRPQAPNPVEPASQWRRYILFQGVELHVREPLHPRILEKVESLLIQARRLFKD